MQRIAILFLLLISCLFGASNKYFIPIPIESSNGRPINNANVDLYTAGTSTKVYDLTYLSGSAGAYYYTSAITTGFYDIYVNGTSWKTYVYINSSNQNTSTIALATIQAGDTTELKAMTAYGDTSTTRRLEQLASGNANGGGSFVQIDSTYPEMGGIVYDNATAGKQWVDVDYYYKNIINPEKFGAYKDSTNATATRTAINRATAFRQKTGKGKIVFPDGIFLCDTSIYVYGDIDIEGSGNTELRFAHFQSYMLRTLELSGFQPDTSDRNRPSISIKNIGFIGADTFGQGGSINHAGSSTAGLSGIYLGQIALTGGGNAWYDRIVLDNVKIQGTHREGLLAWHANTAQITNCKFYDSNFEAATVSHVQNIIFTGNEIKRCAIGLEAYGEAMPGSDPTDLEANVSNVLIADNIFLDIWNYGIGVSAGAHIKVEGNIIAGFKDTSDVALQAIGVNPFEYTGTNGLYHGIFIFPGTTNYLGDVVIKNNDISYKNVGIVCEWDAADTAAINVDISENYIYRTLKEGIRVKAADKNSVYTRKLNITNNFISEIYYGTSPPADGNASACISVIRIDSAYIAGNRAYGLVASKNFPVYLYDSDNSSIVNNDFTSSVAAGQINVHSGTAAQQKPSDIGLTCYGNLINNSTYPRSLAIIYNSGSMTIPQKFTWDNTGMFVGGDSLGNFYRFEILNHDSLCTIKYNSAGTIQDTLKTH